MKLRDEAIAILCNGNSCKRHREDFDHLLDWLDTNAQHVANTIDNTPGVRYGWFNYFHVKALVSVLREDDT